MFSSVLVFDKDATYITNYKSTTGKIALATKNPIHNQCDFKEKKIKSVWHSKKLHGFDRSHLFIFSLIRRKLNILCETELFFKYNQ